MATFSERIPEKDVAFSVFVACVIPVHIWSILIYLQSVPGLMLKMPFWDMVGVFAYTQAFALFESLLLTLLILGAAVLLPGRVLRDDLAVNGAVIMFVLTIWLGLTHLSPRGVRDAIYTSAQAAVVWSTALLITIGVALWLAQRWERLALTTGQIMSRFTVLAVVYLAVDAMSILIIIFRNLSQ